MQTSVYRTMERRLFSKYFQHMQQMVFPLYLSYTKTCTGVGNTMWTFCVELWKEGFSPSISLEIQDLYP